MNFKYTESLIPEGVQTLSKRPCVHTESHPTYIVRGKGAKVWDEKGREFIDYPCGLGTNILGYGYPDVVKAVKDQIEEGTLFSLSHPKETQLAELLRDTIPSMEMMRFVKTGSESCNAAARIARAYTGRWPLIVCGYHGWSDFYNYTTPKCAGVVKQDVTSVKWGDTKTLEKLFATKAPAAFMLEPYVYQSDDKLITSYLQMVRRLCTQYSVILIFDENVTGFRLKKLSAQEYYRVKPDITCLGKAMANGMPMSVVGGKKEIMDVLTKDCFVSSTFGGDLLGISAAIATMTVLREKPAWHHLDSMGNKIKTAFNQAAHSTGHQDTTKCIGQPHRTHFIFPTNYHKGAFWQMCVERGILFGHAQFVSFSHTVPEIDKTIEVMRESMYILNKHWDEPQNILKGPPPIETLRMVQTPNWLNKEYKFGFAPKPEPPKDDLESQDMENNKVGGDRKSTDTMSVEKSENYETDALKRKPGRPKGSRNKPK